MPAVPIEAGGDFAPRSIFGDALDAARILRARGLRAHVVYVDPPYASQADYVAEARLDGVADGRKRRAVAFGDKWRGEAGIGAYLDMLAPRLEAAAALLHDEGTLWVHLDWRSAYLVRVVLDEIFGRDRFINEIVWRRAPNLGRQAASAQFGRTLDTILVYGREGARITPPTRLEPIAAKAVRFDDEGRAFTTAPRGDYTDASIAKLEREGRVHRTSTGRVYIKYFLVKDEGGVFFRERRVDALWTDVPPLRHATTAERTGYPDAEAARAARSHHPLRHQPRAALVVDFFCGSGTTLEAARSRGSPRDRLGQEPHRDRDGALATDARRRRALDRAKRGRSPARRRAHLGRRRTPRHRFVDPNEPLAWSVDTTGADVFRATWHAERTPGGPASIPAFVDLDAAPEKVRVRAFGDDGTLYDA